ncbi:probable glutamate receptor [Scylla paramamosain]|uniref:probable glutamate receptor n=1 Tax=Scylla paramamosain TaxID=85552 RepID=UPI00308324B2
MRHIAIFTALLPLGLGIIPHHITNGSNQTSSKMLPFHGVCGTEDYYTVNVIDSRSQFGFLVEVKPTKGKCTIIQKIEGEFKNATNVQVNRVISKIREVLQSGRGMVVLLFLISDDPKYISAFMKKSFSGRLLVWSTRLILVTQLQYHRLKDLHKLFSISNSLLLIADGPRIKSVRMSLVLPHSDPNTTPPVLAIWTPRQGFTFKSHLFPNLFPKKFDRLSSGGSLVVSMVETSMQEKVEHDDPLSPGKKKIWFNGYLVNIIDYLASGLNFSYSFSVPADGTFGTQLENGSYTGMVGQIHQQKADISLGPFAMNPVRAEAVEFSFPYLIESLKVIAGRGSVEVDPWGFILPLTPMVWVATLIVLLGVFTVIMILHFLLPDGNQKLNGSSTDASVIRIILQQDITSHEDSWIWERLLMGVWMLMTLVLTRSYSGNLMSLLAVRYVSQPFQTLRDVVDDPKVNLVWQKGSSSMQLIRDAESGIFQEINDMEKKGRLRFLHLKEYFSLLDTEVRSGKTVIVEFGAVANNFRAQHFSQSGRCDFYFGREKALFTPLALITQKNSLTIIGLNKRISSMIENGIYEYWYKGALPNLTSCIYAPSRITVSAPFSLSNCWAMFVVLASGYVLGMLSFSTEVLNKPDTNAER